MRKKKNAKQLQEQLESLQKRLEEKTAECGQYVTTIAELNKKNFEYQEQLDEYKKDHEKQKQSAPSPARTREINSHLEKWGAERIQSTYRGRLARKRLDEKITELADFDEDVFTSKYSVQIESYDLHKSTTITSNNADDKLTAHIDDNSSMEQAAIKIQAAHRGHKSRIEVADKIAKDRSTREAEINSAALQKDLPPGTNQQTIQNKESTVAYQNQAAAAATASKISKNAPTSENPFRERENDLNAVTLPDEDNENDGGTPKRVKSIPYKILSEDEVKNHGRTVTHHVGTLVSDEEESFSENSSESDEETLSSDEDSS